MASTSPSESQSAARGRAQWLQHPPSAGNGDPWYAFRSVSYRWVDANKNSRENVMRSILERLFGRPFPKTRPRFLINPDTKRALECDALNMELRIAVEHMGLQHSVFPNPFNGNNRAKFDAQRKRDALKAKLCAQHGIKLVVLPYTVKREDIEAFLIAQLQTELAAHSGSVPADMKLSLSHSIPAGSPSSCAETSVCVTGTSGTVTADADSETVTAPFPIDGTGSCASVAVPEATDPNPERRERLRLVEAGGTVCKLVKLP